MSETMNSKWPRWLIELVGNMPSRRRGFICVGSDFPPEWSNEACENTPVAAPGREKEG